MKNRIIRNIGFICCAFLLFSCSNEVFTVEEEQLFIKDKIPQTLEFVEENATQFSIPNNENSVSRLNAEITKTWAALDGSYFKNYKNTIKQYADDNQNARIFSVIYEDDFFVYIQSNNDNQWFALPKWNPNNRNWSYRYDNNRRQWVRYILLIFREDYSNIFTVTTENITNTTAKLLWNIDDSESYTYDIFLDGERVATDITRNSFRLENLDEQSYYNAKIVAKGPQGALNIIDDSFETHKTITVSPWHLTFFVESYPNNNRTGIISMIVTIPKISDGSRPYIDIDVYGPNGDFVDRKFIDVIEDEEIDFYQLPIEVDTIGVYSFDVRLTAGIDYTVRDNQFEEVALVAPE